MEIKRLNSYKDAATEVATATFACPGMIGYSIYLDWVDIEIEIFQGDFCNIIPTLCPKGKHAFVSFDWHVSDYMNCQAVCEAEVFPLSATTISTAGHLSAAASPGLTDQLFNTTEHAEGSGVQSACLALLMNTFHFLHCGNRFFANDTSFPVGSIHIQGQRGLVWVVRRRAWYNYSIRTHSLCIYSLLYL